MLNKHDFLKIKYQIRMPVKCKYKSLNDYLVLRNKVVDILDKSEMILHVSFSNNTNVAQFVKAKNVL